MVNEELPIPPQLPGQIFDPRQDGLEDIPVIDFEVHDGPEAYRNMLERRRQRALALSPAVFRGIAMTNLVPNPATHDSHHIVRLTDKWKPDRTVDLLFRDRNIYLIAFRRTINEDVATWFQFDNEDVPAFLHAQKLGITSVHENQFTTIGGSESLHDMFMTMAMLEDDEVPLAPWRSRPMKRAKQRGIVVFSEAMRFHCVEQLVCYRIEHQLEATDLPEFMWSRIKSWKVISNFLIGAWKVSFLREDHPKHHEYENTPRSYGSAYGINSMDELIGDIRLILSQEESMIKAKKVEQKKKRPEAALFQDPGLD